MKFNHVHGLRIHATLSGAAPAATALRRDARVGAAPRVTRRSLRRVACAITLRPRACLLGGIHDRAPLGSRWPPAGHR